MRCYLVKTTGAKRYASTNADARETRETLMAERDVKKKDVTIEQVEVPADKAGLLGFINGLCKEADQKAADA